MLGLPRAPRGRGLTSRAPRLPGGHLELSWGEPAQEGRDHERAWPPWGPVSPTRLYPEDTRSCLSPPLSSLDRGVPCSLRFQVRTRSQPMWAHSQLPAVFTQPPEAHCWGRPAPHPTGTARGAPSAQHCMGAWSWMGSGWWAAPLLPSLSALTLRKASFLVQLGGQDDPDDPATEPRPPARQRGLGSHHSRLLFCLGEQSPLSRETISPRTWRLGEDGVCSQGAEVQFYPMQSPGVTG